MLQNSHNTSALSIRNIWGSMYFRPHFIVLKKLCSMHKFQTLPILVNYTDTEELNVSLLLTEVIQVFQHVCSRQSSHMKLNTVCHRSLLKPSAILSFPLRIKELKIIQAWKQPNWRYQLHLPSYWFLQITMPPACHNLSNNAPQMPLVKINTAPITFLSLRWNSPVLLLG